MARTVTYRRRTKTGKVSTVTRRVSGDSPIPSGAEAKRELRRAYKTAGRVKRKAMSVGSDVKKKLGQVGDTRTVVRSKTTSVKITGPKGFTSSQKPRARIVDKQTGDTYVWITKRVGGGKPTGKYVKVTAPPRRYPSRKKK